MPNRYAPDKRTMGEILSLTSPAVVVPEWQRNFSWTTSEVETFYNDLLAFDARYPDSSINDKEYFLGSVVLVDNGSEHLVLDGQQRIATSAILISVIRDYLKEYSVDAATRTEQRYLTDYDDATQAHQYKVTLNYFDRDFFKREILESRNEDEQLPVATTESHRQIRGARAFFNEKFRAKFDSIVAPAERHKWAIRVLTVLTKHMSVVAIVSDDEDDAAAVFETLNDRGIGLSSPDLLRTLILRRASQSQRDEIVRLWSDILQTDGDMQLKTFLRHFWISKEGDVKTQALYREIKRKIEDENVDSLVFSRELGEAADTYKDLISGDDEDEERKTILSAVAELGGNVLYPVLMSAYGCLQGNQLTEFLKYLQNSYVRHNVVGGLEAAKFENVVFECAKLLRENKVDVACEKLWSICPDDAQFSASFTKVRIPRSSIARYLLRNVEDYLRRETGELNVADGKKVHVEHIYPQTPQDGARWEAHGALVDRLGNLTLLSKRLNTSIKNAQFATKKESYTQSELRLTKELLTLDEWNPQKVEERQAWLAQKAVEIWVRPARRLPDLVVADAGAGGAVRGD